MDTKRLYRRCQRCDGNVDEHEEGYGTQSCLRVLDAEFSSSSSSASSSSGAGAAHSLERSLLAGWHARALRMGRAAALLSAPARSLNVEEKVCAECARALFAEYELRLRDQLALAAAYYTRIDEMNKEKQQEEEDEEEEERATDEELAAIVQAERELAELLIQEELAAQDEMDAEAELFQLQTCRNEAAIQRASLQEAVNTGAARATSLGARLEEQLALRVHEDLFSISRDRFEFPVINGFRLGSTQTHPIEWEEINAALGETALLLHVCAAKLNFQFRNFRPVPIGAVSRMEHVGTGDAYSLAGSFRTAVMSSQFNTALGALLQSTDQMAQAASRKYGVKPPYKVANGGRILVSRRGRDGNFVQFAKKILGSGVDQDGDHCRTYVDETGKFSFHVLVNQGLTFLCFSKNDLEKGVCFDFLYDLAAAFVENYAASLDDQDTEVFRDFEATMSDLMQEHGQPKGQALAGRYDSLKNKQFCGFRDSNGTIVAVTETQVDVTVFGVCVKVVCTKKYRNKTDAAQELFFTFKLDGATVCGFETSRGKESVVRAESDEWRTDPAFVVRELTRGGRAAFLLDEVGETETVNVLVGTLQPGEKLRATITYSTQLEMSGSLFELFLPLTRSWCDTSDAVFSLTVQLHMGSEIVGVACESGHEIEFEKTGVTGVVTVDSENILRVNAELLLYVTVASPHTPQLAIERGTGPGSPVTICVGWNPLFRSNLAEDTPSEFVFIADRSRALQGRKMGRLRSALMLWLHSLPTGCSFNIYAFAPEAIVQLFALPQVYSDASLRLASKYIADLEASSAAASSGTALATALARSFALPMSGGRTRQMFVLLADEAGCDNSAEILRIVSGGSQTARLYSFALGPRSNQSLARRMAKVASGFYEFLPSDQFLESAVVDRVVRSSGPGLTEVATDWSIQSVEQVPSALPCVFSDNRNLFVVFGSVPGAVFDQAPGGVIKITLRGFVVALADGREFARREVVVSSPEISVGAARPGDVVSMACRARRVAGLLTRLGGGGGVGGNAEVRAALLREARAGTLLVDGVAEWRLTRAGRPDNTVRLVPSAPPPPPPPGAPSEVPCRVVCEPPAQPPQHAHAALPASPPPQSAPGRGGLALSSSGAKEEKKGFWGWLGGEDKKPASSASSESAGRSRSTTTRAPLAREVVQDLYDETDREPFLDHAEDLEEFLALQRANGRWLLDAALTGFATRRVGLTKAGVTSVPKRVRDLGGLSVVQQQDVWATCLAVQILFLRFEDVEPTWAAIASKAKGFLFRVVKRASPAATPVQTLASDAKALLELATRLINENEK